MRKIRLFFRYSSQFSWRENRGDEVEEEEEEEEEVEVENYNTCETYCN